MPTVLGGLLGEAAHINPEGGVLAADSRLYTWPELDDLATRLAGHLVRSGVNAGDRVAVLHPKSVWSFVAVHAIVRCGGVMVPLDPLGPVHGVEKVLRFCAPAAIIGGAETLRTKAAGYSSDRDVHIVASGDEPSIERLGESLDRELTTLDDALSRPAKDLPQVEDTDLAYIIFSSGSTGEPKGIAHTHRSALAYAENACAMHGLTAADRVAGTSPLHFDMSTLELYATPLAGATAVTVTEGELRFPATLSKRFEDARVTVVYAVPYQLRQLCLRGDLASRDLSALRQVSFGGEQFAPGVLEELAQALPPAELLNVYGPAEVNGVVSRRWPPRPSGITEVPIGHAWPGVSLRIVDDDLIEVPVGHAGELVVTGDSQMSGYWRRPDLDDECFVALDGRRWYRTGDIVRAEADGTMYFLGRADTRVKVRGVRIELETIEAVLSDAPGVDSAVVGVAEEETGFQQVVAWLKLEPNTAVDATDLRRWCKGRLPDAAIPGLIHIVESFAQSRTGKIDRRALRATLTGPQSE